MAGYWIMRHFGFFRQWSDRTPEEVAQAQLNAYYKRALELGITTVQDMALPTRESHLIALFKNVPPPITDPRDLVWIYGRARTVNTGGTRAAAPSCPASDDQRHKVDARRHARRVPLGHEKALRGSTEHFGRSEFLARRSGSHATGIIAKQ